MVGHYVSRVVLSLQRRDLDEMADKTGVFNGKSDRGHQIQKREPEESTASSGTAPPPQTRGQQGPGDSENDTGNKDECVLTESGNGGRISNKPSEMPPDQNEDGIDEATTVQHGVQPYDGNKADNPSTMNPQRVAASSYSRAPIHSPAVSLSESKDETRTASSQRDEVPPWGRHNEPVQWYKVVPIAVVMAIVAIVSYYVVVESWPDGPLSARMASPRDHLVSDFLGRFEELRERFPSQSIRFWRKVEVSTRRVMGDQNPLQPATFLMPVSDENLATTTCLLERLSEAITESYQAEPVIDINVTTMVNEESPDVVKRFIDHTLLNNLESGSKVSIIHHLEKIPLSAALIFQGYCDNENARFKDSVFFYTVYLSAQPVPEDDASIQKKMGEMWSADPSTQGYMPLMGRIVKNIVYVRPEDSGILNRECSIKV